MRKKKQNKTTTINIKLPEELKECLQKFADRYADGNISAWLRYSGMNYVPQKGERIFSVKNISGSY